MKHSLFLIVYTLYFSYRGLTDPFLAIVPYYTFAVLRPQATWQWSLPEGVRWSFYAAIAGILIVMTHAQKLSFRTSRKFFLPAVIGFAGLAFLSFAMAMNTKAAALLMEEYAKILLMMLVAVFAITRPSHHRILGMVILVCLSYLIFNVNQLYVFENRLDIYGRGYGGLDNNGAGLMLAMAIPFMYFAFVAEHRPWRWGYLALTLPAAHAIMLTYSRGAMLSAIVASVGMILVGSKKKVRSIMVLLLIGAALLPLAGKEVRERFSTISESEKEASANSRFMSWEAGWEIAKDYPLLGVGLRNSNLIIKRYGADVEGRTIHNVYIQIAADTGLPAISVWLLMVGIALRGFWRASRRAGQNMDDREMRWHYATCQAGFWSLFLFCFGAVFLSLEVFELPYLLMVMGATAEGVMKPQTAPKPQPVGMRSLSPKAA
ncbi:MAG: O-antigen ligase family protein [Planctomycetota bacterium]